MKELTIEQKAKAYDEAIDKIADVIDAGTIEQGLAEWLFPELKEESKDERIRKALIDYFDDANKSDENPLQSYGIHTDKAIAWLEKQDDNKSVKNIAETWKDMRLEVYQQASGNRHEPNYSDDATKMFSLNDIDEIIEKMSEQKPDDKVEIKFKIEKGKWYVCIKDLLDNYANKAFYKGDTYLSTQDGSLMPSNSNIPFEVVCPDTYFRDWTIKDAKDGDVLVTVDDEHPFIYKGCLDPIHPDSPVAYCGIDNGGDFSGGGNKFNHWWTNKKVQPATKEQRDTLFKAMADDGYTFDFEKKGLKKIEQPELTEFEDAVKDMMDAYRDAIGDRDATTEEVKKHAAYMLSLIPHKPVEWSEEDMSKVQRICKYLNESKKYYVDITEVRECMDWLKSLKDRVQTLAKMEKGIK